MQCIENNSLHCYLTDRLLYRLGFEKTELETTACYGERVYSSMVCNAVQPTAEASLASPRILRHPPPPAAIASLGLLEDTKSSIEREINKRQSAVQVQLSLL